MKYKGWHGFAVDSTGTTIIAQGKLYPTIATDCPGLKFHLWEEAKVAGTATGLVLVHDDEVMNYDLLDEPLHLKEGYFVDLNITLTFNPIGVFTGVAPAGAIEGNRTALPAPPKPEVGKRRFLGIGRR